jgi:hypothetical protein
MQHAGASLVAGMLTLGREIVVPDSEPFEQAGWVWSFIARILVLLAARWSFGGAHAHTRRLLLPFSAALLMASFAMLVSAYYEFGELCCERHDTMRACFITLSFAAAGAWSADWRRPAVSSRLGAFAWVAAILILFVPRVPEIVEDWQTAPHAVAARAQTWASGLGPGSDMTYFNPPEGHITGTDGIPPGRFAKVQKLPAWYAIGILDFFGKKTLTILPPGH